MQSLQPKKYLLYFRQYRYILQHNLVSCDKNLELGNMLSFEVLSRWFGSELFCKVELFFDKKISCICTSVVEDDIHVWSPFFTFWFPLAVKRAEACGVEWEHDCLRQLGCKICEAYATRDKGATTRNGPLIWVFLIRCSWLRNPMDWIVLPWLS